MKQGVHTNKKDNCIVLHVTEKRFGRNVTTGALVGRCVNGKILIGWSRVNIGSKDKFDANLAWLYASHNLLMGNPVPDTMKEQYLKFVERCTRYFQGGKLAKVYHVSYQTPYRRKILRKARTLLKKDEKQEKVQQGIKRFLDKMCKNIPDASREEIANTLADAAK